MQLVSPAFPNSMLLSPTYSVLSFECLLDPIPLAALFSDVRGISVQRGNGRVNQKAYKFEVQYAPS